MRSLNAEPYFVHYLGLNLCFWLQINEPVVLKLTKKCVGGNGDIPVPVSNAIIYMHNINLNLSKQHLKVCKSWALPCVIVFQRIFILMMHFNALIPSCPMICRGPNKIQSVPSSITNFSRY